MTSAGAHLSGSSQACLLGLSMELVGSASLCSRSSENGMKIRAVKQEKPDDPQDGEEDYQMIFIKQEESEEDKKNQDHGTTGHKVEASHQVNKTWPSDEITNLVPVQYIFVPDNPQGEAPSVSEPTSYILVNVEDHRYEWQSEMGMRSFIQQEARTDSGMHDGEWDQTFHCLGWIRADMEHVLEGGIPGCGGIEKPYQCSVCQRRFRETSHLSSHMKVHGAKLFQCSLCQRRFWGMNHLSSHMRSHRAKQKPSCDAGSENAGEELAEQTRTIREDTRMQRAKEKLSCDAGSENAGEELAEQTRAIREDMRMHRAKEKPSGSGNADKELAERTQTIREHMRSHRAKQKPPCDAGSENAGEELAEQTRTIREDMRSHRVKQKPSCVAGSENAGKELAQQTQTIREDRRMQRAKQKPPCDAGSENASEELGEQTQTVREDMRMQRVKEKPPCDAGSANASEELAEQTQTTGEDMRMQRAEERPSCNVGLENAGKELGEQTHTIRDMRSHRAKGKPSCDAGRESAGEELDAVEGDETQTRREALKCRICCKEFSSRYGLIYHVTRHAKQKVLPRKPLVRDEPCGHEDRHERKKKRRVVKPGKYQPRKCAICYEELRDRFDLTEHLRKHRTDELHKSPRIGSRCNEASHKTVDLSEHTGKHRADMHYTCTVCSQSFSNSI